MDKRKKRTSINQYLMYIELLEKDKIFRTGITPREAEPNYLGNKWRELAGKLNTCPNGPQLSPEEWKKRLNDWKNSTRCKYRRSISGEKDISMSPLEVKALSLFGKTPVLLRSPQTLEFKSEAKALYEAEKKHQAAAKAKDVKRTENNYSLDDDIEGIYIDEDEFNDDDSVEEIEVKQSKLNSNDQTNGGSPKSKRRRTIETTVYQIKSLSPKNTLTTNLQTIAAPSADSSNNNSAAVQQTAIPVAAPIQPVQSHITVDTSALEFQLKRIADIKAAKLEFEIAKYKYNNPGFIYSRTPL